MNVDLPVTLEIGKHVALKFKVGVFGDGGSRSSRQSDSSVKRFSNGRIFSLNDAEGGLLRCCYLGILEIFCSCGGFPPVERNSESRHKEDCSGNPDLDIYNPIQFKVWAIFKSTSSIVYRDAG